MIFDTAYLKTIYPDYSNLSAKIANLVDHNFLVRLKQNLYTDNYQENPFLIANKLYGPSYISFESALFYYGLIPDVVQTITSATINKNRSKLFVNKIGRFAYNDIPEKAFNYGIVKNDGILIATREKALCDLLYISPQANSQKEFLKLISIYWRIEDEDFYSLDIKLLSELLPLYKRKNHKLFLKVLGRKNNGFNR